MEKPNNKKTLGVIAHYFYLTFPQVYELIRKKLESTHMTARASLRALG